MRPRQAKPQKRSVADAVVIVEAQENEKMGRQNLTQELKKIIQEMLNQGLLKAPVRRIRIRRVVADGVVVAETINPNKVRKVVPRHDE